MFDSNAARAGAFAPRSTLSRLELRCPPLPSTLVEAMELIENPERLEVAPVTDLVQRDPVVVARLLHIVNSAYYGLRHSISSADRAVVMLGPVSVAGIIVGMNMLKLRSALDARTEACFGTLIRHSLATAFLTRHLLERTNGGSPGRLGIGFTAGLLHDFGKIILTYNYPDEAVRFYGERALGGQVEEEDERTLEALLFGCDHCEAGEYVARKLGFPDLLADVVRLHHDPAGGNVPEHRRLVWAVRAANHAAKAMGFAVTTPMDWDAAAEDPSWHHLAAADETGETDVERLVADVQAQQGHLEMYLESMQGIAGPDPAARPTAAPTPHRGPRRVALT